jgi:hypothetical protein
LVSDRDRENPHPSARAGREAVSAVKLPERTTAAVDAWAEARHTTRSEAICQLVELGLSVARHRRSAGAGRLDSVALEDAAVRQIGELLDPALSSAERERRIRRLIEGPPEFSAERIDLPKHET